MHIGVSDTFSGLKSRFVKTASKVSRWGSQLGELYVQSLDRRHGRVLVPALYQYQ